MIELQVRNPVAELNSKPPPRLPGQDFGRD